MLCFSYQNTPRNLPLLQCILILFTDSSCAAPSRLRPASLAWLHRLDLAVTLPACPSCQALNRESTSGTMLPNHSAIWQKIFLNVSVHFFKHIFSHYISLDYIVHTVNVSITETATWYESMLARISYENTCHTSWCPWNDLGWWSKPRSGTWKTGLSPCQPTMQLTCCHHLPLSQNLETCKWTWFGICTASTNLAHFCYKRHQLDEATDSMGVFSSIFGNRCWGLWASATSKQSNHPFSKSSKPRPNPSLSFRKGLGSCYLSVWPQKAPLCYRAFLAWSWWP